MDTHHRPPAEVEGSELEDEVVPPVEGAEPTEPPVEPEPPFGPEVPEEGEEVEIQAESAETVAELLERWGEERKTTENSDERRLLSWRIMKMESALNLAGQKAEDIKIASAGPGILGFYRPDTKDIYFTPYGIGDVEHYGQILVHETAHQSGKADEGVAQLDTRQKVGNARRSIYLGEQLAVEQRFDVPDLLEKYDIKDPEEFAKEYLAEEWEHQWEDRLKAKADQRRIATTDSAQRELFRALAWQMIERLEQDVKVALPRLYEKSQSEGFKFEDEQFSVFQELYEAYAQEREKDREAKSS